MISMKKIIAGNWKMNPDVPKNAKKIFLGIKKKGSTLRNVQTIIAPPHIYVSQLQDNVSGHRVLVGAQDAHNENAGAHTGETSPLALTRMGVKYVILGHSERRAAGETDETVHAKLVNAIANKLTVILCVGERERDEHGEYLDVVRTQLVNATKKLNARDLGKVIVAYEPIWAIGAKAKRAASPEDLHEMVIFIKKVLSKKFGRDAALRIPVLYGGSVNDQNAEAFLGPKGGADGLLVGRASLDVQVFGNILEIANRIK